MTEQEQDALARSHGYSDEEIAAFKSSRKSSEPKQNTTIAPIDKPFGEYAKDQDKVSDAVVAKEKKDNSVDVGGFAVPNWVLPVAGVTAAGAAGYVGKKLASGDAPISTPAASEPIFDDKFLGKDSLPKEPVDATFSENAAKVRAQKQLEAIGKYNKLPTNIDTPVQVTNAVNTLTEKLDQIKNATSPNTQPVVIENSVPVEQPSPITEKAAVPPEQPAKRGRPVGTTNAAQSAFLADANANAPEGMRYNPANNKVNGEKIGRGAYNWVAGQEGPNAQAVWENIIGKKNITYDEAVKKYKNWKESSMAGGEPGQFPDPTAKINTAQDAGAYPRSKYIPRYIKGGASPTALAVTAGLAAIPSLVNAFGASIGGKGVEALQHLVNAAKSGAEGVKSIVTQPYEAGKSLGQGDPIPAAKLASMMALYSNPITAIPTGSVQAYQAAMDGVKPAPYYAYEDKMKEEKKYKEKVGAGRGVAPPESYKRY